MVCGLYEGEYGWHSSISCQAATVLETAHRNLSGLDPSLPIAACLWGHTIQEGTKKPISGTFHQSVVGTSSIIASIYCLLLARPGFPVSFSVLTCSLVLNGSVLQPKAKAKMNLWWACLSLNSFWTLLCAMFHPAGAISRQAAFCPWSRGGSRGRVLRWG